MSDRIKTIYYADGRINGVAVECGEEPTLIACGHVNVDWTTAASAIRYGWRITNGFCDGSVTIFREYGFNAYPRRAIG
jgi:hypothetical protein